MGARQWQRATKMRRARAIRRGAAARGAAPGPRAPTPARRRPARRAPRLVLLDRARRVWEREPREAARRGVVGPVVVRVERVEPRGACLFFGEGGDEKEDRARARRVDGVAAAGAGRTRRAGAPVPAPAGPRTGEGAGPHPSRWGRTGSRWPTGRCPAGRRSCRPRRAGARTPRGCAPARCAPPRRPLAGPGCGERRRRAGGGGGPREVSMGMRERTAALSQDRPGQRASGSEGSGAIRLLGGRTNQPTSSVRPKPRRPPR
jgi:hypothetical protein